MSYKILENNAIDNTNIEGAVFNKFVAGRKSGIIEFANNCSLSSTGNSVIISTGILLLSGVRVRLTAPESFTVTSAPVVDTRYQVIAQLINTDGENFTFSIFPQDVLPLVQNDILNDAGVYQLELGRFTHLTTGDIEDVVRTADILTAGGGGADFEIGEVTTEMLAEGIPAEVDIEKRTEDDKTFLDFTFAIPKGDKGSNPNILINGDFAINQRGQTSYTGATNYTVDRWQRGTSFITASVLNKGVRLTASTSATTGENFYLYNQTIEDYAKYAGQIVTASLAYENNTFANGKINIRCDNTSNYSSATMSTSGIITFTLTLPSSITSSLKLIITGSHTNGTAETIDLLYAKLELGSIATPFIPPLTAEELPKCQRYYQKIMTLSGLNIFGFGVLRDTTNLRTAVPISVPLRTTPTVAVIGSRSFNFATNTTYTPDGATTISGASPNQIYLQTLHSVSMGTVGTFMQLFGNTATDYISFDAEIY